MIVKFLNGGRGREVNAAVMATALLRGKTLKIDNLHASFDVAEWREFCSIAMHAFAECTRDWRGQLLRQRIPVEVTLIDGRVFNTSIWYDEEFKALRYVSLY